MPAKEKIFSELFLCSKLFCIGVSLINDSRFQNAPPDTETVDAVAFYRQHPYKRKIQGRCAFTNLLLGIDKITDTQKSRDNPVLLDFHGFFMF